MPPLPLGFVSGGTLTIDGQPGVIVPFNAVFRQPFTNGPSGFVALSRSAVSSRSAAAFYMVDDGSSQKVRSDERAVGWPTVRFEISLHY